MHALKRIAAATLVAAALSVAVAAPSVAMPIDRGKGPVIIVWTKWPAGWEGRSNRGGDPLFIYGSPYDYSDYGQANRDGTITTYGEP